MPAKWSVETERTSVDLPLVSRQQIAELMSDNDETLRDCLIICIAERWQREIGTPDRDVFAELDEIKAKLGMD